MLNLLDNKSRTMHFPESVGAPKQNPETKKSEEKVIVTPEVRIVVANKRANELADMAKQAEIEAAKVAGVDPNDETFQSIWNPKSDDPYGLNDYSKVTGNRNKQPSNEKSKPESIDEKYAL